MSVPNVTKTARTWCFTWNNYTKESEMRLQTSAIWTLLCYGREIAGSGTKHLQGTIVLKTPQRLSYLKSMLGSSPHWEICRNLNASLTYCKKDGDYFFVDNRKKRGPKSGCPIQIEEKKIDEDLIFEIIKNVTKMAGKRK